VPGRENLAERRPTDQGVHQPKLKKNLITDGKSRCGCAKNTQKTTYAKYAKQQHIECIWAFFNTLG